MNLLRCKIQLLALLVLVRALPSACANEKATAEWAQTIREGGPASVLCERKVFDSEGEKPRDIKKHQFRRQRGALFFRSLADYADATNYANSRMMAAGLWDGARWAVQANDLYLTDETEGNHDTNSLAWVFGALAQDLADEVFCWGIRNLDPATFVGNGSNHFRASLRQAGWETTGEVLEFSDDGLPTKLVCVLRGPNGPYRTNLIEYTFGPRAKAPCLPKEIKSFLVLGDRRIPHVFLQIEESRFANSPMPKDEFLPVVFSSSAPFRFELVTTSRGLFQRQGSELVKVTDRSSVKPVGARLRYIYFLVALIAGGTLVLVLRRRSPATKG